jgi:hypothetical protein
MQTVAARAMMIIFFFPAGFGAASAVADMLASSQVINS